MRSPTLDDVHPQRSFDELGTPLHEVTFCIVDLETTGSAPATCEITEVGAVKLRGGECLGTFQTLVDPGVSVPPEITVLTGITTAMVQAAPRIERVLPALLEFAGGSVIVGHNVRFDLAFLAAALVRCGYGHLSNHSVDTCALARRLLRDEVPDCRLGTLASCFRLSHQPCHRALDDALATGDLLHLLLERAGTMGVLGLDDLLQLPTIKGHPQANKLKLTSGLPREPGVYLFRDRQGRVLYVGKAANLRTRVRSYFSGDERRKIGQLLRETCAIDHIVCAGTLEAAVLEVRLIHQHLPRFNRQAKLWRRYAYLKLTLGERFPRLSVVRATRPDGAFYLGPLPSVGFARRVAEAIESAVPLRRCAAPVPRTPRGSPCTPAQLGVSTCPCAGAIGEEAYGELVSRALRGLTTEPSLLLEPLQRRMHVLAEAERFEEASDARDRAGTLAAALRRQRRLDGLRRAGALTLELPGEGRVVLRDGRLASGELELETGEPAGPLPRHLADEVACVAGWLDGAATRVRLIHCDGELCSPLPPLPSFSPSKERPTSQGRSLAPGLR